MSSRRVTRDVIAESALALVDAEGSDAITMRRLADQLGVTAMALYNHVDDKQAVLDAVAERVLSELDLPDERLPWQKRIAALFTQLRDAYLRHPHAIVLVQTAQRATPPTLVPMEYALQALQEAGLEPSAALEAWAALIGLTNGLTHYQIGRHLDADPQTVATIDATRFPAIAQAVQVNEFNWDHTFIRALRAHISQIQQTAAPDPDGPGPHPHPRRST